MDVDFWNAVFQWGSVALIAVTFIFGAGALWTGNRINQRQSARLVSLESDLTRAQESLAHQQEKTANAERALLELKERQDDRRLTDEQYMNLVRVFRGAGKPHITVRLMFIDQGEPRRFAELLASVLGAAGWKAEIVKWNRAGMLTSGVFVESGQGDSDANVAARIIAESLVAVGSPAMTGESTNDDTLPRSTILLRVGPKIR